MDVLQEVRDISKKSFLSHVFSTTEEGKAEILNVVQYATLGIIPIVLLNKAIQRFIPEADSEKSSLELLVEVFLQTIIMFCGIILIHRFITYFPTYSGFKYENLTLTNVILAFLVIVLSIQTKLGIKVNILFDRVMELWNGPSETAPVKKRSSMHTNSQSDYFENIGESVGFPPAPIVTSNAPTPPPVQQTHKQEEMFDMGPQAANGVLGGSFGSFF
jgi:small-conductance mechanosensitive channel